MLLVATSWVYFRPKSTLDRLARNLVDDFLAGDYAVYLKALDPEEVVRRGGADEGCIQRLVYSKVPSNLVRVEYVRTSWMNSGTTASVVFKISSKVSTTYRAILVNKMDSGLGLPNASWAWFVSALEMSKDTKINGMDPEVVSAMCRLRYERELLSCGAVPKSGKSGTTSETIESWRAFVERRKSFRFDDTKLGLTP